jgi:hypothetical protein
LASPRQDRANARARAAGYRNAYDYRIHGYGRIPATERISGEQLARARGHRSAADLERAVGPGDVVSVWTYGPRDSEGRYKWVDVLLLTADGRERIYRLRGGQITARRLDQLAQTIDQKGAVVSPAPSLDIRTLIEDVNESELDEGAE